jgi:hypothetical protein
VLFRHDSRAAPQTVQTASPVCGTKNLSSVRLYSAPQLHCTIVTTCHHLRNMRLGPSIFQPETLPQSFPRATKALGASRAQRRAGSTAPTEPDTAVAFRAAVPFRRGRQGHYIHVRFPTSRRRRRPRSTSSKRRRIRSELTAACLIPARKRVANSPDTPYQVIDPAIFA